MNEGSTTNWSHIYKVKMYKAIVKKLLAKQKLDTKENDFLKKEKVI